MTQVINIKDAPRGWKKNPDYVYIGRPSKWGNPYTVQFHGREECIIMFEATCPEELLVDIHELKDKILVCYCKPEACHGDFLARKADA